MMRIAHYDNLSLHHGTRVARIYRGVDSVSGNRVIVKVARHDPVRDPVPQLQHDYQLCRDNPEPWRLTPIEWRYEQDHVVSVFHDTGGEQLQNWPTTTASSLGRRLKLALALVDTLKGIHAEGLVHKDFAPTNLLIETDNEQETVTVMDFSLSTRLSQEETQPTNFSVTDGNPAFCSPEQTGRMNRHVTTASDFYMLGATLYQLFTGLPPFTVDSDMELIHAQIAVAPTPPIEQEPELPQVLSDVILKLLSKAPEERYQSLGGLRRDLARIESEWNHNGHVNDFTPGETDQQREFTLSSRLYGREQAESQLMAGFEDAARGRAAITMVTGPSGIGKTALIRQLYGPITSRQAYFIRGKFDLLHRDQPYTALMDALQQLLRDMLTESEGQLEQWRPTLQEAVGSNGGLLTPLIPELALIIGPQGVVENLEADESSRVFARLILRLLRLFCTGTRPLVLYLDDLQWADRASLELLDQLHRELNEGHFYFIGAYRDHEVSSGHFLNTVMERMASGALEFRRIRLSPVDRDAIAQLLADSLGQPRQAVSELAGELLKKTGGVPFFVHQFLESLYRKGRILPSSDDSHWNLSLESLGDLPATDSQVEWMMTQLREFEPTTQQLLQSAACLGARFKLNDLARLENLSSAILMDRLQPALKAGMISVMRESSAPSAPSGEDRGVGPELMGHFAHDRIQQAAYQLVSQDRRREQHRLIGNQLLQPLSQNELTSQLFEIAQHLNLGGKSGYSDDEMLTIARLNRNAGERARNAAAHNASYRFYSEGIDFLPANAWETDYELTLSLYNGAVEAAFLSQRYTEMEALADTILSYARQTLDAWAAYSVRIHAYNVQQELNHSIEVARTFLNKLGVQFPKKPRMRHVIVSLLKTRYRLYGRSIDGIRNMPEMEGRLRLAIMHALQKMAASAYFADAALHPLIVLKMVRMVARYGHAYDYTPPYAAYSIVLCGVLHQYQRGFEFGQLSLEFAQHARARPHRCQTQVMVYGFAWHWKRYAGESIEPLQNAYTEGLETGDHEYAAYARVLTTIHSFFVGLDLDAMSERINTYYQDVCQLNSTTAHTLMKVYGELVSNLQNPAKKPWQLTGNYIEDEDRLAEKCVEDGTSLSSLLTAQLMMRYRFGRLDEALSILETLDARSDAIRATLTEAEHQFFAGLTRVAAYSDRQGPSRLSLRHKINRHRKLLRSWAQASPTNFRHKHLLFEAEWARVRHRRLEAMRYYEAAISSAEDNGFIQDQALSEELAGAFCRSLEIHYTARTFEAAARSHYQQWGAPALAERLATNNLSVAQGIMGTQQWSDPGMDLTAFKSSLLAISRSQVHSTMMDAVIRGAVTFAGAQSGQLLLARPDGEFYVEASWRVEEDAPGIFQATPLEKAEGICHPVVRYVAHTGENLVIDDARNPQSRLPKLHTDAEVTQRSVRSVLCVPLITGEEETRIMGILYLENNATAGTFTPQRLETLEIICLAAAGRLELSRRAVTDGLTHLYNHEYFQNMLETEIQLARRKSRNLSLVMLDVDYFKDFNDQWGHQCGDTVLRGIAETLSDTARSADIVARYGGEEFAIILPETNLEQARVMAERVRSSVGTRVMRYNDQSLRVTVSLGIAELTPVMQTSAELLAEADHRLYQAKENGRNQVAA